MKTPISQKEIKVVVAKLHNEGLSGNDFEATFCQYILETCGIDYSCPTITYRPYPDIIKHRANEVSEDIRLKNIEYWKNRLFE
jgi:hypothetical protein